MLKKVLTKRNFFICANLQTRHSIKKRNPGIGHQVAYIEDTAEAIESDPEGFGDLEADFAEAHKSHRQHELEMQIQRDRIRHLMIKNKYFRTAPLPNLLTYAEKEHIRVLHNKDPDTWTVERLAESFPATPEIVQKIIKANWKPYSAKKLRAHNVKVFENWQRFKMGELDKELPSELKEHLLKFAHRRLDDLKALPDPALAYTPVELPKPKTREFQSIITSCPKYKEIEAEKPKEKYLLSEREQKETRFTKTDEEVETYMLDKIKDNRCMRLKELKALKLSGTPVEKQVDNETTGTTLEQLSLESFTSPSATGIIKREKSQIFNYTEKFTSSEIVISAEDQKRLEITTVKERIRIPRKLWRKDATYRVEDCYYDDDGEFLYRVPGMTFT